MEHKNGGLSTPKGFVPNVGQEKKIGNYEGQRMGGS